MGESAWTSEKCTNERELRGRHPVASWASAPDRGRGQFTAKTTSLARRRFSSGSGAAEPSLPMAVPLALRRADPTPVLLRSSLSTPSPQTWPTPACSPGAS